MTTYFSNYGPEQRAMVEQWLAQMRRRFAGARDASDIGIMLARERHLEILDQPQPMSAQRLAKLEAEVPDVRGEGPFLLVVDCGETGSKATRFVRRFVILEELQQAKRQVDAERCGPGCWRNHLLYRAGPDGGRLMSSKERVAVTFLAEPRRHPMIAPAGYRSPLARAQTRSTPTDEGER
jgi:hypothetical protein